MFKVKFDRLSDGVMIIGCFIFIGGLTVFFHRQVQASTTPALMVGGLTEHRLAVEAAKSQGKTTYSYDSHFIPGIGYIASPEQFKNQQLQQLQNSLAPSK